MPPSLSPLADPLPLADASGSAPAALPSAQAATILAPLPPSPPSASAPSASDQFALDLPARQGLDEVRGRVLADDEGKWDVILPRQSLLMDRGTLLLPSECEGDYPPSVTLSPWATAQACTRLGIPTAYFRRCPTPLQDAQFNHWAWKGNGIHEDGDWDDEPEAPPTQGEVPERWLLRAKAGQVRGILSQRYVRLDNRQLLDCLHPLLQSRYEVKSLALTEESLHLRLVDPALARDVLPNDRLVVGLHVANSEVGRRAVSVDALVYRLVCANGLIKLVRGRSLLRHRHVSWDEPRFAFSLERALGEALTAGAGLIEQLSWAARTPVADVDGTLAALVHQGSLTQELRERVRRALLGTPPSQQETAYGLVNALTFVAQGLCPDDRYDLEVLGGRLLENGFPKPLTSADARLAPGMRP